MSVSGTADNSGEQKCGFKVKCGAKKSRHSNLVGDEHQKNGQVGEDDGEVGQRHQLDVGQEERLPVAGAL